MSVEHYIPRRCRQLPSPDSRGENFQDVPLAGAEMRELPAYVLLGDAGMGKTTAFEEEAAACGGDCLTVREFLRTDSPVKPILFLDALDEQRAGSSDGGGAIIDKVYEKLQQQMPEKIRLSCRAADWLGDSDLKTLKGLFPGIESYALQPLTEGEIQAHLNDAPRFQAIKDNGLIEMLGNPLLLYLVSRLPAIPKTREGIYSSACEHLIKEKNPEHRIAISCRPAINLDSILQTAGKLFTVMLAGGKVGVTARHSVDDRDDAISIDVMDDCEKNDRAYQTILSGKLLHSEDGELRQPVHRSIAEYLSGGYLAKLAAAKTITIKRILGLFSHNAVIVSALRGLYGWFASLYYKQSRDFAIVKHDPVAFAVYGDLSVLLSVESPAHLKQWFSLYLEQVSLEYGASFSFWQYKYVDALKEEFRVILNDHSHNANDANRIMRIIREVKYYQFDSEMLAIIDDSAADPEIKYKAAVYFTEQNKQGQLRPAAKNRLVQYALDNTPAKENTVYMVIAQWLAFIIQDLPLATVGKLCGYAYSPKGGMPRGGMPYYRLTENFSWRDYMDTIQADDAYFLVKFLFKNSSALSGTDIAVVMFRKAMQAEEVFKSPDILNCLRNVLFDKEREVLQSLDTAQIKSLLTLILQHVGVTESVGAYFYFLFRSDWKDKISSEELRKIVLAHLLNAKDADNKSAVAEIFFYEVHRWSALKPCDKKRYIKDSLSADNDLLEGYAEYRQRQSQLKRDKLKIRRENRQYERQKQQAEAANFQTVEGYFRMFREHIDQLRNGHRFEWLCYLLNERHNSDLHPVIARYGDVMEACTAGCESFVYKKNVSDEDIIQTELDSKRLYAADVYLHYIRDLYQNDREKFSNISDDILFLCILFQLTGNIGEDDWLFDIDSRKHCLVQAFRLIVREDGGSKIINVRFNFDRLSKYWSNDDIHQFLDSFPATLPSNSVLEGMQQQAIMTAETDRDELCGLIAKKLKDKTLSASQRTAWFLTLFCLDADKAKEGLARLHADNSDEFIDVICRFFDSPHLFREGETGPYLTPRHLKQVIEWQAAKISISPPPADFEFTMGESHPRDKSCQNLIIKLAQYTDQSVEKHFADLLANKDLAVWHETFRYELSNWRRNTADNMFQYKQAQEIADFLNQQLPVSRDDFQQQIIDTLYELEENYLRGDTNGWEQFWRDANTPRVETYCRDRLLEDLRYKGIMADPERHLAGGRRADIFAACLTIPQRPFSIPVEIKKADNRELRTGIKNQLKRYADDPAADRYGVYLVLWFGEQHCKRIDGHKFKTRDALQEFLNREIKETLPDYQLRAVVMDLSRQK